VLFCTSCDALDDVENVDQVKPQTLPSSIECSIAIKFMSRPQFVNVMIVLRHQSLSLSSLSHSSFFRTVFEQYPLIFSTQIIILCVHTKWQTQKRTQIWNIEKIEIEKIFY
jgi:hypothetical protein